jgi:cystathionine beta-lyase
MEFPDLRAWCGGARRPAGHDRAGQHLGRGIAFDAFRCGRGGLGVDIAMHALTKYPSGGGDVLMGSVCTRDEALHER